MDNEAILKQFGLEEISGVGKHVIRNEKGWKDDELWISGIWQAHILPSFHQEAIITTIEFLENKYMGKTHPNHTLSSIYLKTDATLIEPIEIENDPVVQSLQNVNIFPSTGYVCLTDGICYRINVENDYIKGTLLLDNPTEPSHVKIVTALFSFASNLQKRSKNMEIAQYLREWKGY